MSKFTEKILGIVSNEFGEKSLIEKYFSNRTFDEISLGPVDKVGLSYEIVDCKFINCKITPGEFVIRSGVSLKNVLFENVVSEDCLTISTSVILDNVVLKGKSKKGGLWVKPDEVFDEKLDADFRNWVEKSTKNVNLFLDISEFQAPDIEIIGISTSKIKINPNFHFVMKIEPKSDVNWNKLGIGPTSFLRMCHKSLKIFGSTEGVFGLPLVDRENYQQFVNEMAQLRSIGMIF